MSRSARPVLLAAVVALTLVAGWQADPARAANVHPDSSDVRIQIHAASADEQPGYDPVDIERPDGSAATFWVGDPVMTIAPDQVQKLTMERNRTGARRLTVQLDADTGREFTSVTRDAQGGYLALRLGETVLMVPQVMEPIAGGQITLFNVPTDLLGPFAEAVWARFGD